MLPTLTVPVAAAPMAGGPSTPELVAAVSQAGGLGFLAAGYKTVEAVRDELAAVRRLSDRPFGVNVFLPGPASPDSAAVAAYRERLAPVALRFGVEPGQPRWDDDAVDAKLAAVAGVPVVSLTFGCPSRDQVAALQAAGSAVRRHGDLGRGGSAGCCRGAGRPVGAGRRGGRAPRQLRRRRQHAAGRAAAGAARRRTGRDRPAARRRRRADGRRGRGRCSRRRAPPGPGSAPRSSAARRPGRTRPTWPR